MGGKVTSAAGLPSLSKKSCGKFNSLPRRSALFFQEKLEISLAGTKDDSIWGNDVQINFLLFSMVLL
jgi:hypothetical protein